MNEIDAEQARAALDATTHARRQVADEIGLPRGYWWVLAAGWLVLGALGDWGPDWLVTVATVAFGVGHSIFASRLLDGRRRTGGVQVSAEVAGHRTPLVVVAMLVGLVASTIGLAIALQADGAGHPRTWAALVVASVVGFGGPEILRVLRRGVRA